MTIGKHYLPPKTHGEKEWHVTVSTKSGEFVAHYRADDEKECQAIATIARGESLSNRIVISTWFKCYDWA